MYSEILIKGKKKRKKEEERERDREHQFVMFPGSPIHPCSRTSMRMHK
jgi:hypothetical protein